jgi:hypothetical protein
VESRPDAGEDGKRRQQPFFRRTRCSHRFPSTAPRTTGNPLFAVNYADREIRKDLAEHRRETVCFARSAAMSMARLWVYVADHNCR